MNRLICGIIGIVMVVAAAGCGYRLSGGYLNENVSRVAVAVFENRSNESGAGVSFANELIREITEKSDTQVVDGADAARVIEGTITSITFDTLSRVSAQRVTERRVTATVDVMLKNSQGDILWAVKNFSADESYDVDADTVDDDANKREALDKIAERVAERLVSRMMSQF